MEWVFGIWLAGSLCALVAMGYEGGKTGWDDMPGTAFFACLLLSWFAVALFVGDLWGRRK